MSGMAWPQFDTRRSKYECSRNSTVYPTSVNRDCRRALVGSFVHDRTVLARLLLENSHVLGISIHNLAFKLGATDYELLTGELGTEEALAGQ